MNGGKFSILIYRNSFGTDFKFIWHLSPSDEQYITSLEHGHAAAVRSSAKSIPHQQGRAAAATRLARARVASPMASPLQQLALYYYRL